MFGWEKREKEMDDEIRIRQGKLTELRFACSVTMPQTGFLFFLSIFSPCFPGTPA